MLGEGGMGTVYLGVRGRRLAAVKTLRGELLDQEQFVARFRRERQAVEAVRHRFVPRLLDADPGAEEPWLATEYVAGPTVERCVEDFGPLPEGTVRVLGGMLASALAALHGAGVVHRDLKPSNVLLALDGPRLVDFGIARMPGATVVTLTGQRPGTPGYMSPEQVLGREVGPAGDVFALGSVLAYASSGHHAFGAEGQGPADFAVAYEKPDLSRVPPALAGELRSCFDKDPERRPSAQELARRWAAAGKDAGWLPGHVVGRIRELRRVGGRFTGTVSRRRVMGLAAFGALAAGASGAWWAYGRDRGADAGIPLWDGAAGERPEPVWSVSGLDADVPFGPAPAGEVLLVAHPGRVGALDPRTGHTLWSSAGSRPPAPAASRPVLIGADGVLAGFDGRTGERVWRGPGKLERLLAVDADTAYAVDTEGHVVGVRTDGSDKVLWRTAEPVTGPVRDVAAAAGGGVVLVTSRDGTVLALDRRTGQRRWAAKDGPRATVGDGIAILAGDTLRGLSLDSGTQRWEVAPTGYTRVFGTALVHRNLLYVTDTDVLRCLRPASGDGVWEAQSTGGLYATSRPVAAAGGLYVPLAEGTDGVAAVPLAGDSERYRFTPTAGRDSAWSVAAVGDVVTVQNGARLYALPLF
ncbi:PQQ-binding-like beta-propeller repeat protein [Streptomyces sp. NPDC055992]|uniref:protein kinase domain-containing protein n=1 Tax=Streptomyces sp. NPDC055992 TaxID=3345673 RepID=UPI0035DFA9BE